MADDDVFIRELVCELCRQFFTEGWVTGTGGSISIRSPVTGDIYMTPSGVQKERIKPHELFVVDLEGKVKTPPLITAQSVTVPLKLSDCAPLFLHAFRQRQAGAVLHSHSRCCNIVTSMFAGESEFRISHQEMIKGIDGHGYFDQLVIPIIENTAWEHELADSLGETIAKYPKSCAVLVRRHGMYVWGKTWEQAKRHGECLHYLFEIAIEMHKLGMDFNSPPSAIATPSTNLGALVTKKRKLDVEPDSLPFKHLLLDIEGTTTPLSFVKDVLFPFSASHVSTFLRAQWTVERTQSVVRGLLQQANDDVSSTSSVVSSPITQKSPLLLSSSPIPLDEDLLQALVGFVQESISKDRKIGALKTLQGFIWEEGYATGLLHGQLFDEVGEVLERVVDKGLKVSIYSSGSKHAQRLLFKHSTAGDLTPLFSSYFDTAVGSKLNATSYSEIALSLGGVTHPNEILFVTDMIAEAIAAKTAGLQVLLSDRAGNIPLDQQLLSLSKSNSELQNFKVITSLQEVDNMLGKIISVTEREALR